MAHRVAEPYRAPVEWRVATGERDERDRYPSAVRVYGAQFAVEFQQEEKDKLCSGVVVSPRLVLTSASCLCQRREAPSGSAGKFLSDSTACAISATARTITHDLRDPEARAGWFVDYDGSVTVHPKFKMVLDEQGNVLSSEANLATIALKGTTDIPAVELAYLEVKVGDSLTVVGYGDGDDRRFSTHAVTKMMDSGGWIAFEQPRGYGYKGARGGPCLRATGKGASLVAILSLPQGREAPFTSVSPYKDWLRDQISRAAETGAASPRHP
jgi:hypothetical protein